MTDETMSRVRRMSTRYLAFVAWRLVPDWLCVGWMVIADLGPTHGEYSALMSWPCGCVPVRPAHDPH